MQKHTPSKLSELESQLAQLEDELKKAKEQLSSSEAVKRRAQQDAEKTKKQLLVMSARLEESQQQLLELSNSEDSRVKELRKLSQERDRVWQSEVEAMQKQHSMGSAALASALNEIQKLKRQIDMVAKSEATQSMHVESAHAELENLRVELSETFSLIENMRKQLNECKGSEAHALEVAREAQVQLQETMKSAKNLQFEGLKAKEAYNSLVSEVEQSKGEVTSLENLVRKLKEDLDILSRNSLDASGETIPNKEDVRTVELKGEIESLELEIGQLKSALEASELRYQEEYIQSTLQIRNAYDQVERAKSDSSSREAEFEAELKKAKGTIEELKSEMMTKETMLKNMSEKNKELSINIQEIETSPQKYELEKELKKLKEDLEDLNMTLMAKETQFRNTREENEKLKEEIYKREKERSEANEEADELKETAMASERDALLKLGCLTEEADKSSQRAARVSEQLNTVQTANAELEAELMRLKVQSEQWRKAAEAAATMLSNGGNTKFVDRTISLESSYNTPASKMDSPISDDLDDDSLKKKNGNMLKKIGVLWKKGGLK